MDNGAARISRAKHAGRMRRRAEKTAQAARVERRVESVSPGDDINLRWTGYPGVPQWLGGQRATVLAVRQGRSEVWVTVQAHAETDNPRTIRLNQVLRVNRPVEGIV